MSAILKSLNTHNFPIFQPILMKLVSKPMVYRAVYYETKLSFGFNNIRSSPRALHVNNDENTGKRVVVCFRAPPDEL